MQKNYQADNAKNLFSEWLALRDQQRSIRASSPFVIKGSQLPWETNPQGMMRWYLHPALTQSCHRALIFFLQKIPPGSKSGIQHSQGGIVHFVVQGKGRTVINETAHAWETGDLVQLPLLPEGVTFQHFNEDNSSDVLLATCMPNLSEPLGVDRGSGFFQLEAAPEFRGEFRSELSDLEALRALLKADSGKAIKVEADSQQTTYDRNYARTREIQERSRSGKVVVHRSDRPEE